jgi:hypothetical protein
VADLEKRIEKTQNDTLAEVLERGIAEGALRADLRTDEAISHLIGPLLFAHLTGSVPLDDEFVARTVDAFLTGYAPKV